MPSLTVGQRVLTPMDDTTNGGMDYSVAFVTEITDPDGPNGGVLVNIQRMSNTLLGGVDFIGGVEVVDYEPDARQIGLNDGIGAGAWPCDLQ